MVSHSFYESDNRIIRYAEALAENGDHVEVLALRRAPTLPTYEVINGVHLHRIRDRFGKNESSPLSYLLPILRFQLAAFQWFRQQGDEQKIDLVHVHNIPDFLVFGAWPAKRRGASIILDIHDIVPEFFASKFGAQPQSLLVSALKKVESASADFADHVILANHLWLDRYTSRSAEAQKCSVFINNVDRSIFQPPQSKAPTTEPLVIYPGGLQWHQGLDIAIRAFEIVLKTLPNATFHIYGDGNRKSELVALVNELGLDGSIKFFEPLSLHQIARVVANADLGVVPKRADSFGNEAYSTKIMEFMSLGVPVVVSATRVDRHYFDDTVVCFFESGNIEQMAQRMLTVLTDREKRDKLISNASAYVERECWDQHKQRYLALVEGLLSKHDIASEAFDARGI
jgi:glycosyltransferase involved in cell wall biosynthesis